MKRTAANDSQANIDSEHDQVFMYWIILGNCQCLVFFGGGSDSPGVTVDSEFLESAFLRVFLAEGWFPRCAAPESSVKLLAARSFLVKLVMNNVVESAKERII